MSLQEENESEPHITSADPFILIPGISKEIVYKKIHWISRFSGIFYTLMASFLFVCTTFTIQQLGIDLLDALILRFFLQTIITFIFVLYKHYTVLGGTVQQIFLQIICCTTGAVGFFIFFVAIRYIELSDATTLCYTRVVWTVVLSVIVYRERPSIGTLIALPLTLFGVVFVTQPSFLFPSINSSINPISIKLRMLGFALAFACSLTSAINVLLFKRLISTSRDIKPSVLNLQFSFFVFISLMLNQLYKIFYLQTPTSFTYILSWRYLVSSVVCLISILASVLTQKAIKREHPAVFLLLGSADIIFALILQNIFTPIRSNLYALLGSGLVISSVILLGISRIINERHAQEQIKQKTMENGNSKC
jgi:drug/metabolite transporter (DMT)-like permease